MGKYSHLKGTLEKFQEEPKYQQRVEERKAEFTGFSGGALAGAFHRAKIRKREIERLLREQNLTITALEQMLVKDLESQGYTSTRHERAGLLSIQDKPYTTIIDQPAMVEWAEQTGRRPLLTINYQTMSGIVNTMLSEGTAPPKFVKVYMKAKIGQTGANKEEAYSIDDDLPPDANEDENVF